MQQNLFWSICLLIIVLFTGNIMMSNLLFYLLICYSLKFNILVKKFLIQETYCFWNGKLICHFYLKTVPDWVLKLLLCCPRRLMK